MPAPNNPAPLYELLGDLQQLGLTQPQLGIQLSIVLLGGLLAWLLARRLGPRLRGTGAAPWRFAAEGVARLLFPLLFWLGIEFAALFWQHRHSGSLLRLAASLTSTMVVVRAAVYLLQEVFAQSGWIRRAIPWVASGLWLVFALHITGILPEIQGALDGVGFTLGKQRISVLMVLNGLLSIAVTMLLAMWLGRLFEQRVMAAQTLNLSLRVVITKVIRTLLIIAGVMIALPLVGIDLTVLSVFGGALGVGLGFGLQKIASNYVSGFIILLDGSVRIGDLVIIDGRQGTITAITSRYVLLKLADGTEAIIPNETLITNTVLNLSHSNPLLRMTLPVQVAYGTDLERAMALLEASTHDEARVLDEPAPQVLIKGFGESGIDLELGCWIADPDQGTAALRSQINLRIWKSFAANKIEIPYPRRDVQIVPSAAIQAALDTAQSSSAR